MERQLIKLHRALSREFDIVSVVLVVLLHQCMCIVQEDCVWVSESLVVGVAINIVIVHFHDYLQLLPILFLLQVIKHREECLDCQHRVATCLMHRTFSLHSQYICYFAKAAILTDLVSYKRLNIEEFWEENV